MRQNSFSVRITKEWNSLPKDIIYSLTIFQFKTKLDKLWMNKKFEDINTLEIYRYGIKKGTQEISHYINDYYDNGSQIIFNNQPWISQI